MEGQPPFNLKFKGRQVLLRIGVLEGGKKPPLAEIQKLLRAESVEYRPETLLDIYRRATHEYELLSLRDTSAFEVEVEVSPDAQQAWITITAPDKGEDALSPAAIKQALDGQKVEKGVHYDEIKRLLKAQTSASRILIAQGLPKVDGQDGYLEFLTESHVAQVIEDNTVNYRELNLVKNVRAKEVIAKIFFPVPGQDGYDVHGKVLKAKMGKKARYKIGRNVKLAEDGDELVAVEDGYVVRIGDRISVENILEVLNVDSESGNIRFHGVVRVKGQVEDAYVVEAEKGLEIGGAVGKATLTSRGDIRIGGGAINATINTEGNLLAKYLTECQVEAGGSVTVSDYILHSRVSAGGGVKVTSSSMGFISGGTIRAGDEISAAILGAEKSEDMTLLEVGAGVDLRKSFDALDERIDTNLEVFEKLQKNLRYLQTQRMGGAINNPTQEEAYRSMLASGERLRDEIQRQGVRFHKLRHQLGEGLPEGVWVMATDSVHPGVVLTLQQMRRKVSDPLSSVGFTAVEGQMQVMPVGRALKIQKQQKIKQQHQREQQAMIQKAQALKAEREA
ncbi:MAG: FapA family protein [Deltaproteobacteria bacterium]|nr:FapA family protein [Deltaproteobacteria bacterium]